jgi:hypothetical protein
MIQILKYSEKSFVVIGDTKEIKEQLDAFGGKWNRFLKHPETKEPLKGWIFSNKKLKDVEQLLNEKK